MFKFLNGEYIPKRSGDHYPKRISKTSDGVYIVSPAPQPFVRLIDENETILEVNLYDVVKKHFGKVTRENSQIVFDNFKKAGEIPTTGIEIDNIDQYCAN